MTEHVLDRLEVLVLVAIGGFAGSNLRFLVGGLLPGIPGTLAVNVLGSFALALVTVLGADQDVLLFVGVGACGSFTTFSSFAFETVRLFETGERLRAVTNAGLNLVGALLAIGLAWAIAGAV